LDKDTKTIIITAKRHKENGRGNGDKDHGNKGQGGKGHGNGKH
jgi:hypothetical protein